MSETDDLRLFIREMFLRQDRTWRDQWQVLNRNVEELRSLRLSQEAAHEAARAAQEEARLDHEAQRNALLHVLDRLQNGGAQA